MGFNSTVVILNDRLDEIAKDPEFGRKLVAAIMSFSRSNPTRMSYVTGQTQVIEVAHADNLQIIAVGGNTGRTIGWGHWKDDDDTLIKRLEQERRRKKKQASPPNVG